MILIFPFHYSYILNTIHSLNYAYSKQANCTLWTFLVLKAAIKIKVKIARFSSFSKKNFCYIWWFFRVLQHIWHSLLWKIIKYKFFHLENEEKSSQLLLLLLKWPLLEPKMFTVHCNICGRFFIFYFLKQNVSIWWFFKVESGKCAAKLGKIIKYSKNLGGNEEFLLSF